MKLSWLKKLICWSNYHDRALLMAKLKDMLNEVAPMIKLDILQKYFLHIYRFNKIQKPPAGCMGEGLWGKGDESYNMGVRTDHEKSQASNCSTEDSWHRRPLLGVCLKWSIIWEGWQDLRLDSIQLTSQLSVFSKIRYKKYWLHANAISPSMVQYILLQLLLQVCTSGFPVQWPRSSFPHEQIRFDLAALQFGEGNERYILLLEENNKGNVSNASRINNETP